METRKNAHVIITGKLRREDPSWWGRITSSSRYCFELIVRLHMTFVVQTLNIRKHV
ncbi:hypothetical protein RYX36_007282 [Vicia faba]